VVAHTPDALPATKLFDQSLAPRASDMIAALTALIEAEAKLEASPERKQLLKVMGDARSEIAQIRGTVRDFLLKPEAPVKAEIAAGEGRLTRANAALDGMQALLLPAQTDGYQAYVKAREAFAPLPQRAIQIRESPEWNEPFRILTPRGDPGVERDPR